MLVKVKSQRVVDEVTITLNGEEADKVLGLFALGLAHFSDGAKNGGLVGPLTGSRHSVEDCNEAAHKIYYAIRKEIS